MTPASPGSFVLKPKSRVVFISCNLNLTDYSGNFSSNPRDREEAKVEAALFKKHIIFLNLFI